MSSHSCGDDDDGELPYVLAGSTSDVIVTCGMKLFLGAWGKSDGSVFEIRSFRDLLKAWSSLGAISQSEECIFTTRSRTKRSSGLVLSLMNPIYIVGLLCSTAAAEGGLKNSDEID